MSWLILCSLIIALLYTALVVKNERSRYLKQGQWTVFGDYQLLIPPWWTPTLHSPQALSYARTDYPSDWHAHFERKPCDPILTAPRYCSSRMHPPPSTIRPPVSGNYRRMPALCSTPKIASHWPPPPCASSGPAGQFSTQRCHLDLLVIKHRHCPYYDLFYSWSSILYGLMEGPYFDEVLRGLRLLKNAPPAKKFTTIARGKVRTPHRPSPLGPVGGKSSDDFN